MLSLGNVFKEKLNEALKAVLPIVGIVLVLCFTIAPVSPSILLCFLMGAAMIIIGMMFFTLGAEIAMTPMGERLGVALTKSRSLPIIIGLSFLLGFIITISEPDLQVLSGLVPSIPNMTIVLTVAVGVGVFLVIAIARILFSKPLPPILVFFYAAVFILAQLVPKDFWAVSFDSGGVTTGPMTTPFIMAFGVGVSSLRSDKHASDDSFGLIALCSVGPILCMLILGMLYNPDSALYSPPELPDLESSQSLFRYFASELPDYMGEMSMSLLPIVGFFFIFQIILLRLSKKMLIKICAGLVYTYIGLVLFLTGANVGFMPAGNFIGRVIASGDIKWIIVPVAMLMGYFIVKAEPAVYVLNKQVEEITAGAISAKLMGLSLSIGVAVSLGLAMIRVITGISIMWFLIPGYVVAIVVSFYVPKIYTAIAFDSGGVASGPMTTTLLLPLAQGACLAVGGNMVADAFGVVAMVAMTPLITVQVLGFASRLVTRKAKEQPAQAAQLDAAFDALADDAIIEL